MLEATGRVRSPAARPILTALAELRSRDVDVLFLDIQMPGLTGFDLLERLDRDVLVIFTTAYDQYALDAFAVNSIDYLPADRGRTGSIGRWTSCRACRASRSRMSVR